MTVEYQVRADVAVIAMNNPPLNGLDHSTRLEITRCLDKANTDACVRAIVLTGAGKAFSSGADLKEFGSPDVTRDPDLPAVISACESSPKPIVAALKGVAMGGGLELALGCHYRIAAPDVSIALPEVKLGLIPGAGGTQRLPRVLGVEPALSMCVSGEAMRAETLAEIPGQKLFDAVATSATALLEEAVDLARSVAERRPLPRVLDLPCRHPVGDAYFMFARRALKGQARHGSAALGCLEAVEAATKMRFDDGLAFELDTFKTLLVSSTSQSLRHLFMAERLAAKIPDVPEDTPQRAIRSVAVIGAGTMGTGISMAFLDAGLPVTLVETREDALERGVGLIRKHYETQVGKGRLNQADCDRRLSLLNTTLSYEEISGADLAIDAVFEDMGVKQAVFEALDRTMKPGAILATNTSTLDVNRIAAFTRRPADVLGLHFFSPANVMKLLEVVRGEKTAHDVLATVMALARKIRKTAVVSGVCDGFIGNRMIEQYTRQAGFLLDEGATPKQVDWAIENFGFAMGPFRMSDMAGNDIGWAIRKRRVAENPGLRYSPTADLLCEMGRLGQKVGAGWYDYQPGLRDAKPSRLVEDMIAGHRASAGTEPRRISDDEIVQRLVFALVNEGARILEEGVAARAGDIDVVYVTGYGFPAHRGGPMFHAQQFGLSNVVRAMRRFQQNPLDDADFWEPTETLLQAMGEGSELQ